MIAAVCVISLAEWSKLKLFVILNYFMNEFFGILLIIMKLTFIYGFVASTSLLPLFSAETQIKVLDYITDFVNTTYVNTSPAKLKVIKVNETYNRLYIKAEIQKEFPLNTEFDVTVSQSKNNQGPWQELSKFTTFICRKKDPNRKYLPHNLIDMSRTDGQKCVQKGDYEYQDAGIFKFYEILPVEQGFYYKSKNVLRSDDVAISITRVTSQAVNV